MSGSRYPKNLLIKRACLSKHVYLWKSIVKVLLCSKKWTLWPGVCKRPTYCEDKEQKWNLLDSSTSLHSKVREGAWKTIWLYALQFHRICSCLLPVQWCTPATPSWKKNPGRKSSLPLISLHICHSLVSFSYMAHLVLVLALISLWENNAHFLCLLCWQLSRCCRKLTSCWLVLVVVRIASLPIDCSAEEGTVTCWEERVSCCSSSWIFRTLVCTLSSCLSMQLFWRLTFPHILQMAAI